MAFAGGVLQFLNISQVIEVLKKYQYSDASYYQLGHSLGLSDRTLGIIEAEHKGDDSRCLLAVLKKWLSQADNVKSKGGPSYDALIAALRAIGENAVADGIDREKKEFPRPVDVTSNEDTTAAREARNQSDDRSLWPKDIDQLLRSVGVFTYKNVDSTSSGPYESTCQVVDCKSLKELISNPSTTVMVQPFLFSLSGLPRSGKTEAFNTFMTHSIKSNDFVSPDVKTRPSAADDLAHYDLIAVHDDHAMGRLLVTEATREFSCVFGLFSAFKQLLSKERRVPLFDPTVALPQNVFEEPELNEHLQYMYRYIGASFSEIGKLASYAEKLKVIYPEKSALVNIWDIPSNSAIHDVLSALQGHFSNNHLALLLDLERDLDKLREPPKVDGGDGDLKLMKWRPRIHYLLRTCRMSESLEEDRSEVCTVFATHNDDSYTSEELKRKSRAKLQKEVKSAAEDIGVSKLLNYNIETVSRKGFHILHEKIKKMISEAPSEEIPIAWLFLRSMFHLSSEVFRHKIELKALAVECGMDESSLKRFGKFYTSFGSIFDVGLVNPDAQYVVVKPILFLKKVNELFSSKSAVFPTIAYGIVPESVGFEIFEEDWPAYIDSLICLHLATKIASVSIEMPPEVPLNDPNDTYYFISLCRRNGRSIRGNDPDSVHLITGISTPSGVFNQVKFVRLLLNSQPQRKLVACKNPNQTVISDTSSGTTVTWVDFGPTTQLKLNKPNHELCSAVVQAYREMADNSHVDVKYKFVKFCVMGNTSNPCELVSTPSHTLRVDKPPTCEQCREDGRLDDELTKVWFKALKENKIDKYLKAAMKDGTVKSRITKAVVQGEARAGKTSLKCLLLSQSYKKPSTNCVEASQVAYSFSVNRFGRTGKRWALVDDDEMSDKVLVELKLISKRRKDELNRSDRPDGNITSDKRQKSISKTKNIAIFSSDDGKSGPSELDRPDGDISIPLSANTKTELVSLQPSSSGAAIAGDSSEVDHMEAIAKVKELYEQCKEIQKKEGLSLHQEWLYFVDTGGQIQFQKLLPAFMPFASVLTLVLNLTKSLSDKASTEMELEHDQQISVSEHSLTVEEILKQLLSAIALSTEHFNSLIANDPILSHYMKPPEENLNVLAVATYRDEYHKKLAKEERVESLEDKEKKLKQIFDSMKQKCTIVRNDPLNILYEVDGRKAMRGEFDDPVVDQIAEKLNNQAYEVDIPIKWYCFSILLRKIAKDGCGVLSMSHCQTLGEQLGLQEGEIKSALYFLHILNMLLYYPDSPVDDMVFVIVDSLVDIIRDLVVLVCTARDKGMSVDDDVYKLATEGFLSIKVLKCSKKFRRISQFFDEFGQKLLNLFQHLLIAVPIQEKGIKYFMPALLPVKDVLNTSPFPDKTSTPLLLFFKSAVPMGLFCAFIVHLLSDRQLPATSDYESSNSSLEDDEKIAATTTSSRWRIIQTKESNWSNYFTIQNTSMKGIFVFVERLECIEVHAEYPKAQATKSIKKAIKDTLEIRGLKEKVKKAFYCNCSFNKGLRHVAVVRTCKNDHKYVLRCTLSNKDVDLDEETSSWLNKTDGKVRNTSSSALPLSSDSSQVPPDQSSGSSYGVSVPDTAVHREGEVQATSSIPTVLPTNKGREETVPVKEVIKIIHTVLVTNSADLNELSDAASLKGLADKLFAVGLITEPVKRKPSMDKFIDEFKSSIRFMRKLPKIQEYCCKFLQEFMSLRGSYAQAALALQEEWSEAVERELGIKFTLKVDI